MNEPCRRREIKKDKEKSRGKEYKVIMRKEKRGNGKSTEQQRMDNAGASMLRLQIMLQTHVISSEAFPSVRSLLLI